MSMTNNNQQLIDGLKEAVEFLESKPELPPMAGSIYQFVYKKAALLAFAEQMGSFTKHVTEFSYELEKRFGSVRLYVNIDRTAICTKRVIWDCPDEGLLALAKDLVETI